MRRPTPIALQLKQRRRARRLTLIQLAERIGCCYQELAAWEKGRNPRLASLIDWAQALDCDVVVRQRA